MKVIHLLLLIALTTQASAYFTMDVSSSTDYVIAGGTTVVNATLMNKGDESSLDTVLELRLPEGFSANKVVIGKLEKGKSYDGQFNITIPDSAQPGSYAMPISLHFIDSGGYTFNMVYPLKLNLKKYEIPKINLLLTLPELTIGEEKGMQVTIKNDDDTDHEVQLTEFFPTVLLVKDLPKKVSVPAKSTKTIDFAITTFGALPDSDFTVLLAASYEKNGIHYEYLGSSKVRIAKQTIESSSLRNPVLLVALLAILLAAAFYLWKQRKAKKTRRK